MNLKTLLDTPPWEWPPDTGKVLRKTLLDRRAKESDRLIAADLGGDMVVIDDAMADALLSVVYNAAEPEQLRAKAAISLGPVLEQSDIEGFEDGDPDELPITEDTFRNVQDTLQTLFADSSTPKQVRRRILEASVRAPEPWHKNAIAEAYASGDAEWMLTAVFSMRWVHEFDKEVLEALKSSDPEIHIEAVNAAGENELDAAWSHVIALITAPDTPKPLMLAAIGAVSGIHPAEARDILGDLAESEDEDIAEAAAEAIMLAEAISKTGDGDDDEKEEWIN